MKRTLALFTALLLSAAVLADGGRRLSTHSPESNLLAETAHANAAQPPIEQEYVWFGDRPVAQFDASASAVRYTFTDHLLTPALQTAPTGEVVWRAELEPYGAVAAFRTGAGLRQPLRFPGQESDGGDRTYNQQRWYRSGWGSFTQADPLGDRGSINLYQYADSRPIVRTDPTGLYTFADSCWGKEVQIIKAMREARRGLEKCRGIDCHKRRLIAEELLGAHFQCDPTIKTLSGKRACGRSLGFGSSTIIIGAILDGGGGCACMEALLAHEAAHKVFWRNSEEWAEHVENTCFPTCAKPDPDVGPPPVPKNLWVGKILDR